jgi:urate oxidase
MPQLTAARYGKDNIRVYKVERDEATKTHTVTEMTVCVLLEGDIETSYDLDWPQSMKLATNLYTVIPKQTTAS